jgi:fatty acid desaturase
MADSQDNAINLRIFRTMAIATGLSVAVSAMVGPWRFTTGLLVGGLLALFNHRWLKNSAAAAIQLSTSGGAPQFRVARFLLRYVVIAAVIFATVEFDLVSLPAVLAGLCTFVIAMMVEAFREFYFAIIEREEIS